MFRVLAFLTKRVGIEMQAFIDYYENKHVPLICSLAMVTEDSESVENSPSHCNSSPPVAAISSENSL
jgi:hypothetical protein